MPYRPPITTLKSNIIRNYGWKRKERSHPIHVFSVSKTQPAITKVDLRPWCPPVYDQGELGSCHDDQTEILTENGWILFEQLNGTERLATVNPETSELIYEMPIRLIKLPYNGEIIVGKNPLLDFRVTPDHKMLIRKWNVEAKMFEDNYEFVEAKALGHSKLMTTIIWNGENTSEKYELTSDKYISMDIWLRFLGLYLSKSHCQLDTIHISASNNEEVQFIQHVLNNLEINYSIQNNKFVFEDECLSNELKLLGLVKDKFIPSFVFKQTASHIKEFLTGYFGVEKYDSKEISSLKLANDLQRLLFLSGSEYIIQENQLSIGKNKIHIQDLTKTNYKGFVYCAEVPTYHTLVTRRNYQILISANCTANTIAAAYEFDEIKQKEQCDFKPSVLFIYYGERTIENSVFEDSGADVSDGVNFINTTGICPENIPTNNVVGITSEVCWPYDINKYTVQPPQSCYDFAKNHKSLEARLITQSLDQLKQALINGFPVTLGFEVYAAFESDAVAKTGLVPMPSILDQMRGSLGGHCVLIVGFDDNMSIQGNKGVFVVRNSWGATFGDKGYFYMPYKYVLDPKLSSDFWTITKVSDLF